MMLPCFHVYIGGVGSMSCLPSFQLRLYFVVTTVIIIRQQNVVFGPYFDVTYYIRAVYAASIVLLCLYERRT